MAGIDRVIGIGRGFVDKVSEIHPVPDALWTSKQEEEQEKFQQEQRDFQRKKMADYAADREMQRERHKAYLLGVARDSERFKHEKSKWAGQKTMQKQMIEKGRLDIEDRKRKARRNNLLQDVRAQDEVILRNRKVVKDRVTQQLHSNKYLADLSDTERAEMLNSPEAKQYMDMMSAVRIGMKAYDTNLDDATRQEHLWMFNRIAGDYNYQAEKVGEDYFLSGENLPKVKLTGNTVAQINNFLAEQFSQELKARKMLIQGKNTLYGRAMNNMVAEIMPTLPDTKQGSIKDASAQVQAFLKNISANKSDLNTHAIVNNLDAFLDDGKLSADEKEQVMQNLAVLADMKGVKYELNANGEPLVIADDGSRLTLGQFRDELKKEDKIGNAMQEYKARSEARRMGQEAEVLKTLDKSGVLENSSYSSNQKRAYTGILKDSLALLNMGKDVEQVKKVWDEDIAEAGLDPKEVTFPFSEKYYPTAIEKKEKEMMSLAREISNTHITDDDEKHANRPEVKNYPETYMNSPHMAVMDMGVKEDSTHNSKHKKARKKILDYKSKVKKRDKLSSELEALKKEYLIHGGRK